MTANTRRLIAKLVRFQNATDRIFAEAEEAYAFDSAFDGGEFSGPAIGRATQRQIERAARRFGFTTPEVADTLVQRFSCSTVNYAQMFGERPNLPL